MRSTKCLLVLAVLVAAGCRNAGQKTAATEPDPHALEETFDAGALRSLEAIDRRLAAADDPQVPDEVIEATSDPDPQVRRSALQMLAKYRHPKAETYLRAAARDEDASVREQAIASLAEVSSATSRATLQQQLVGGSETILASATQALSGLGNRTGLNRLAGDPAWKVRAEVAAALVNEGTAGGLDRGLEMLDDSNAKVQLAAVDAADGWPLDLAGPLWLTALKSPNRRVREAAAAHLQTKWPTAEARWPPDDPAALRRFVSLRPGDDEQTEQLAALERSWDAEFGRRASVAAAGIDAAVRDRLADERLRAIHSLIETWQAGHLPQAVRDRAGAALLAYGQELPDLLHAWSEQTGATLDESVYTELLRSASPAWEQLAQFASGGPTQRRQALARLGDVAAQRVLGDAELSRLVQIVRRSEDPEAWQTALEMLGAERRRPALQLASAAVLLPQPDVRLRGARLLAAAGDAEFSGVLAALRTDPDPRVAAIAADAATERR